MKWIAFTKLLNRKINSANKKAQNPFLNWDDSLNPFKRQSYNTLIWVEPVDEDLSNQHYYK